ncbi:type II secretion system protein GspM [Ramlibacter sp. AN1015]|uniref:type II secretion system protein GspM n=1 Tax=Ramlibacter sp. AN1015 TaxID=3133428 RepID=UPI0030BB2E23
MNARTRTPSSVRLAGARARWSALPARERSLIAIAAAVLLAALVWWLLVGPALVTLGTAASRHQALDAQLLQMRTLQAQAEAMKSQPRQNHDAAVRALEAVTREQFADAARLLVSGDRASLTLTGVAADSLARWMAQSRINARALPAQARLARNANGLWEGTVVVTLPPR